MAGATSAFLAVGAGAFAAHALRATLSNEMLDVFHTAAKYQTYHALAMLAVSLIPGPSKLVNLAGWCFLTGTVLFSGSLYGLALGGPRWLGGVTPFGGFGFLLGWLLLLLHGFQLGRR